MLDAGQIVELDTPENLYRNKDGIFRSMCERSGIMLEDLKKAGKERIVSGHVLGNAVEKNEL